MLPVIVPPYDDEKVIASHGTMGLEIVSDMPAVSCVLVPIGGGGLISVGQLVTHDTTTLPAGSGQKICDW